MDFEALADTAPWDWPANAGELILEVLRNRGADLEDRALAAEMAGDTVVVNDALAGELLRVLETDGEPEELRGSAAIALGPALEQSDTDGTTDDDEDDELAVISRAMFDRIRLTLRRLYQDASLPAGLRRRILEAAVRADGPWQRDAVRAAYANQADDWRLTAVFCMGYVEGFEEAILDSLKSTNQNIRFQAIHAAGNWKIDRAWPQVAALARSAKTDKTLLLAAMEAIAEIRPAEAIEVLERLIASDDEEIAEIADGALQLAESYLQEDDGGDFEDGEDEDER